MPPNAAAKSGDDLRNWLRDFLEQFSIKFHHFAHGETILRDDFACHAYSCSWTAAPRSGGTGALMFLQGNACPSSPAGWLLEDRAKHLEYRPEARELESQGSLPERNIGHRLLGSYRSQVMRSLQVQKFMLARRFIALLEAHRRLSPERSSRSVR